MTTVHIRSYNGHYLCAELGGGGAFNATRTVAGPWETFELEFTAPGVGVLRTQNSHYVTAESGGGGAVTATATVAGPSETFRFARLTDPPQAGSTMNLQTNNGPYVCAENGGGGVVDATRPVASTWETFTIELAATVPSGGAGTDLVKFIGNLGHLPGVTAVAPVPSGNPMISQQPGWTTTEQPMRGVAAFDKIVMFGADQHVIWPGSVLQGGSILAAAPAPVPLQRAPLTVTLSGLAPGGGATTSSRTIEVPSDATVADAMNSLLRASMPGSNPADLDVFVDQVYSTDQLGARAGINVSTLTVNVKASMSAKFSEKKASFVTNVTQKYYSFAASDPGPSAPFFDPSVTVADAQPYMGAGNPPVYVSSVDYGRRLILVMQTDMMEQSWQADLQATYQAISAQASGNAGASQSSLLSKCSVTLLDIGGSTNATVKLLTANPGNVSALNAIAEYIAEGAQWSPDSPGMPIGWTIRYVNDLEGVITADLLSYNTLAFTSTQGAFSQTIHQDNSGISDDTTRTYTFPEPPIPQTRIIGNSVGVSPHVSRGAASVKKVDVQDQQVLVDVWTQAAGGGLFGHHSGAIDVDVNFSYYGGNP